MAHKLNFNNGKYSFAKKGALAWHGLGQYVKEAMTSEEAINLAGLDWMVELRPIGLLNELKELDKEIKSHNATVRSDTKDVLGVVGNKYMPLQNKAAFAFFDSIVGSGEAIFETAGCLGKGEIIFITAKFPSYIRVKDENIDNYFLLTHSHDGSLAVTLKFTSVCVVCNNTLQLSLRKDRHNNIVLKHSKNIEQNMQQAAKILGIKNIFEEDLTFVVEELSNKPITIDKAVSYFCTVLNGEDCDLSTRRSNQIDLITTNYREGLGANLDARKDTMWGAFNAITGYFNNLKEYKSLDHKAKSLLLGTDANTIKKAMNLAINWN